MGVENVWVKYRRELILIYDEINILKNLHFDSQLFLIIIAAKKRND